jgi:hypothetical protein
MRVPVGKTLRVSPGDEVVIRGTLPAAAKLGRLFVFASENGAKFSPYVPNVADILVANGQPTMLSPLSIRLLTERADRQIKFKADIDGFIQVMQEVDEATDPLAVVKLSRTINPDLGWIDWAKRKFTPWQTPKHLL